MGPASIIINLYIIVFGYDRNTDRFFTQALFTEEVCV